jgi:hypothetical protein
VEPDKDITQRVREILKQTASLNPIPVPDDPGIPARKIKLHFQIAFYAAIVAFSMAVYFFGASRLMAYMDYSKKNLSVAVSRQIPAEPALEFNHATYTDQLIRPIGKITSPISDAVTNRRVTITGITENIPIDTPFVWLIVDVPSIGRCWPKKPMIQPNGSFQATIFEGGPNMGYTVSLYAVGYGLNKTIEQWLAAGTFGGLPMIPQQYRLDSVRLSLNGV